MAPSGHYPALGRGEETRHLGNPGQLAVKAPDWVLRPLMVTVLILVGGRLIF
jgi:hypothetical protein